MRSLDLTGGGEMVYVTHSSQRPQGGPVPLAEFTFGDALLTVIEIFLFVIYFWILITIFSDLFRRP